MPSNKIIDNLITSSEWLIDINWGMRQLSKYLGEIELLEKGVSIKELGYEATKRAASEIVLADRWEQNYERREGKSNQFINYVQIIGVMQPYGGMCSYGADDWSNFLTTADAKSDVVAHIVDIDSGGGAVSAGAMMYETMKSLKKPVYVLGNFIGSAAYMTAAPAKKIYLKSDFAEAGSIGVMLSLDKEFVTWYRENVIDIYSEKSPNKNLEWREILKGNYKPITQELNETADLFHSKVLLHRPQVSKEMLKGDMVKASKAIETGLVDGIRSLSELVQEIGDELNLSTSQEKSLEDQVDSEEEMTVLKTTENMTVFDKLANQFLRVLGISVTSTEAGMEQAANQLEAMEPVATQISAVTADLTAKVANLEGRLTEALNGLSTANVASASMASKITELETKMTELSAENKTLSERVLGYEAEGSGDNSANDKLNSIQKFEALYDGFVTVQ
jgi:protease-4